MTQQGYINPKRISAPTTGWTYLPYYGPAYHLRQLASLKGKEQGPGMVPVTWGTAPYDNHEHTHKKEVSGTNDPKQGV